ncbi:hypothetical protein ABT288_26045 [Streptomyces sp. NPDC001093]|uniref:hypothetical protein n=1 Tax=Streptomyces sp. NPDC001093 TaxID=3154376 RepID=UPI003332BE00
MMHTPTQHHPRPVSPVPVPAPAQSPVQALDASDTLLMASLATAFSPAGAASATWAAVRAFTRHRTTVNGRATHSA